MLPRRALPLPLLSPVLPDRWICSPVYGHSISANECNVLIDHAWLKGSREIGYYFKEPAPSNAVVLPKTDSFHTCQIAIEAAGPAHRYPQYLSLSPDKMRGWAAWVVDKCAGEQGGMGGFVTVGFGAAEAYLQSMANDALDDWKNQTGDFFGYGTDDRRNDGAYLTITINGVNKTGFAPGDTDPDIAGSLSTYAVFLSMLFTEKKRAYLAFARLLHDRAVAMVQGGTKAWWSNEEGPHSSQQNRNDNNDDNNNNNMSTLTDTVSNLPVLTPDVDFDAGAMTYKCDATLGAGPAGPEPVDCEKLSWSGLSLDLEAEVVLRKGVPRFWSEGTCTLALSATNPTTISWAHILAAFTTLNNLCVQNPIHTAKGGRAYYGQQVVGSWINGKEKRAKKKREGSERDMLDLSRRDSIGDVSGATALPPGVNVTVFRNAGPGKLSCGWVLAEEGKDVGLCDGG